ncbi:lipopolysaccharide biosynthesis protein [Mucilaginibacter sp. HMF5004]|uniref:lipopolysaccharide biosynthesis protein n=1 Tax=Mucilaginibacter rivuli TaxID=2857527 RepID=UPI001C5CF639|nr:lipopolysaccharide biosynthesis protein [Mucilaginibacter rivuli]MBW4889897.1 lipopolysaccharide biosynthesis protein [Mucilaginibacter rivuli]
MEDQNKTDSTEMELSLKEVILTIIKFYKFIRSKWVSVVVYCVIGSLLGLGYAVYKKPVYKAELSFALEDSKSTGGMSAYSGIASQFGLDVGNNGGGVFSGDNLIELMKSRSIIQKALLSQISINGKIETLAELYINFNNLRNGWKDNTNLESVKFPPNLDTTKRTLIQDSLIGVFRKNLITNNVTVEKIDKKLSIIVLTVKTKNELFSKYFAEILANRVSQFYIETKTKKFTQNVQILQHQTDSVRTELNGAIGSVAASIDANPNANPARVVLRTSSQRHQIDVEANRAILAELVRNLEASKVSLRNETPLIQVIDKPILPLDVERIGKLKSILIGLILGGILGIALITCKKAYKVIMD